MSLTEKYIRNVEVVSTEMDGALMMMSIAEGKYFELNPVSKRIWEVLESPSTIDDICSVLLEEYDVTKEQCYAEVIKHIEELKSKNLINPV